MYLFFITKVAVTGYYGIENPLPNVILYLNRLWQRVCASSYWQLEDQNDFTQTIIEIRNSVFISYILL